MPSCILSLQCFDAPIGLCSCHGRRMRRSIAPPKDRPATHSTWRHVLAAAAPASAARRGASTKRKMIEAHEQEILEGMARRGPSGHDYDDVPTRSGGRQGGRQGGRSGGGSYARSGGGTKEFFAAKSWAEAGASAAVAEAVGALGMPKPSHVQAEAYQVLLAGPSRCRQLRAHSGFHAVHIRAGFAHSVSSNVSRNFATAYARSRGTWLALLAGGHRKRLQQAPAHTCRRQARRHRGPRRQRQDARLPAAVRTSHARGGADRGALHGAALPARGGHLPHGRARRASRTRVPRPLAGVLPPLQSARCFVFSLFLQLVSLLFCWLYGCGRGHALRSRISSCERRLHVRAAGASAAPVAVIMAGRSTLPVLLEPAERCPRHAGVLMGGHSRVYDAYSFISFPLSNGRGKMLQRWLGSTEHLHASSE